ncbi:hypothetical protein ACFX2G_029334 [Malus domestica]
MARRGNPISVRLDLNRSSDSSRFSEGDRESHRMGQSFSFSLSYIKNKSVGGRCRCPGRTRLLLTLEDHWKTPGTRACRERSKHTGRACFDRVSRAQLNVDIMNARCWIPGRETPATTPLCADR